MYKWEEGLNALGLQLIKKVDEKRILVRMDGFEFLVYKSGLAKLTKPTIMTCTDKTGYFFFKYKDRLTDKLDYSKLKYIHSEKAVTVTCPIHGDIEMSPEVLSRGNGCNACGNESAGIKKTNTHEYNLKRAREVHGERYTYGFLGVPSHSKVEISCPSHGAFIQKLTNHTDGKKGCPECARESNPAFNRSAFAKYPVYYLYVMRLYSDEEDFLKIGISKNSKHRAKIITGRTDTPYTAEVVYTQETDGVGAWDLEKLLHREFKEFRHKPKHNFKGSTECFSSVCLDPVKKIAQCCA